MTVDELLKPRVKVIADFWDNPFEVGQTIQFDYKRPVYNDITDEVEGEDWYTDFMVTNSEYKSSYGMSGFKPYPHLFRFMHWSEERNMEDMPKYVLSMATGMVFEVEKYDFENNTVYLVGGLPLTLKSFLETKKPITKEEFYTYSATPATK